ncbi:hypothetical protein REMIM1_PE00433 (plasmid) [Rhizobium etli bv. mimosae str. Mim1]|nr:hypothetical protein REMIM1_PE00433 [Rhizobium etli bv. mimosae str. Mim1]
MIDHCSLRAAFPIILNCDLYRTRTLGYRKHSVKNVNSPFADNPPWISSHLPEKAHGTQ